MTRQAQIDLRHVVFQGRPLTKASSGRELSPPPGGVREVAPLPDGLERWILHAAGLDARLYRREPLRRRLPACLRAASAGSVEEARALIDMCPALLAPALNALLIGVTQFFRDPDVFDVLAAHAIPSFAGRTGPVRVWSAGCSSGAELYSAAMLLARAGLLDRSEFVGTDCRADAIEAARLARYPSQTAADVPPDLRDTWLEPCGRDLRPIAAIRRRAAWKTADVTRHTEPGPWDVVLWRNAAIYLTPAAADDVFARLATALAPGGFLVVGRAERPPAALGLSGVARCVYQKVGN